MSPETAGQELQVAALLTGLFGGLAIFLFGMEQMTGALKAVAGGGMRRLLGMLTQNRFLAMLTGAFVTAVIQSSSVTTVLVVGFISAGLLTLSQSVGVIIGANIGTTITAQIIAFKVTKAALVLISLGFGASFLSSNERIRQVGTLVMGLGLVFFGMTLMSDATTPLRSYEPFIQAMSQMDRPLVGIGIAAAFTALVQSSSATTGIVIVLASQGFITLEAGIALALGANIGTCVTAVLAAAGKPRAAVQAAGVHVFFNVVGVLVWLPFVGELADLVRLISPTATGLAGAEQLAADVPRQVANAHTAFNVANAFVMIAFTGPIASLIRWILPDLPTAAERAKPRYLDDGFLETPALAVDLLRMEIGHLGELVRKLLSETRSRRAAHLIRPALIESADEIDSLYEAIASYASALLEGNASESETAEVQEVLRVANHLHNIGDTISVNARAIAVRLEASGLAASEETRASILGLIDQLDGIVALTVWAYVSQDQALAAQVIGLKSEFYGGVRDLERRLAGRLVPGDLDQLTKYRLEIEMLEVLKRIYYFTKRIAKTVASDAVEPEVDEEQAA